MKLDTNTRNDLRGLIEHVDNLKYDIKPLKGIFSHEVVREHVPREAFLAALDVVERGLKSAQEWAASLRKCLDHTEEKT